MSDWLDSQKHSEQMRCLAKNPTANGLVPLSPNMLNEWANSMDKFEVSIKTIRRRLHAANRPKLREGLRIELRDLCDEVLSKENAAESL